MDWFFKYSLIRDVIEVFFDFIIFTNGDLIMLEKEARQISGSLLPTSFCWSTRLDKFRNVFS